MESPTIRTRNGLAAVGSLGLGGTVVVVGAVPPVLGVVPDFRRDPPAGRPPGRGPATVRPPPGPPSATPLPRPVMETMWDSCRARLTAATGPVTSRLTVRRVPTGDTWALCCRVGAYSRNQTAKAATPSMRTCRQGARTRSSSPGGSSACACDWNSDSGSQSTWCGGTGASLIRSGSR